MKSIVKLFVFGLLTTSLFWGCNNQGATGGGSAKMETLADSMSYAVGVYLGQQIPPKDMESLNTDLISTGLSDFAAEAAKLDDAQVRSVITRYTQEQAAVIGAENMEKGQTFLEENKNKEGVQVTDSGLQYKVLEEGEGPSPTADDVVKVHYTGKLIDGEVFDSSVQRGTPAQFKVGGVIAGWTEALQMMKPGSKWELYIPSDLAYGAQGKQPIGPNETLIFEVELLEIVEEEGTE